MLIDTHSHLNFKSYDEDRDEVIKRNRDEGVVCIDIGTDYQASKKAVELGEDNENIFAAIGVHPTDSDEKFDKEKFIELAKSKKVVAIGEIGLDYYHEKNPAGIARQKELFLQQLDLAEKLDLPVIIHCRDAFEDVYKILKTRKLRGVVHCFSDGIDEAKKYLDLGFYLGINGIIFKQNLDEVIKNVPLDKILLETDCPFLTPPASGVKRNEPIFVKYVAEKVAELKGISLDEVTTQTTLNAKALFGI